MHQHSAAGAPAATAQRLASPQAGQYWGAFAVVIAGGPELERASLYGLPAEAQTAPRQN